MIGVTIAVGSGELTLQTDDPKLNAACDGEHGSPFHLWTVR